MKVFNGGIKSLIALFSFMASFEKMSKIYQRSCRFFKILVGQCWVKSSDVNNETLVDRTYIKRLRKFSWVVWRTLAPPMGVVWGGVPLRKF